MITKQVLIAASLMVMTASGAYAQDDAQLRKLVPSEARAQKVSRPTPEGSFSKMAIERPLKKAISDNSAPLSNSFELLLAPPAKPKSESVNPRSSSASTAAVSSHGRQVRPGNVDWERDFKTACLIAKTAAKPVLHFQMMGRLDEEFC